MVKSKQPKARILFVEDDKNLNSIVEDILIFKNYEVVSCFDGDTAMIYYSSQKFDLVLLDVMMPKMDGITLAREIRKKDEFTPIIFLTAKSTKEDMLEGYKSGADDYITKPFDIEELLARVEAVLKRTKFTENLFGKSDDGVISIGKYSFNSENLILSLSKNTRKLTKKEGQLLKLLYLKRNEVLTRGLALKVIWGNDDYFMGRSMDVYVSKLRKYLSDDPKVTIENIHGVGFKLVIS
jgi:two-component system, OmpR family, response regulator VicR